MSSVILAVNEIEKKIGNRIILSNLNLRVNIGEMISILGPSGSGKSSLLNILGLIDMPNKGSVIIDGKDTKQLNNNAKAKIRNKTIGFVFQFHHLLPEFTALENVCLPSWIDKYESKNKTTQRAKALLEKVGMEDFFHAKVDNLSGGEQQRIAIARALINTPKIILADEPSGNLDNQNAMNIFKLFRQFNKELHITFIIVTHNQALASKTDKIYELKDKNLKLI